MDFKSKEGPSQRFAESFAELLSMQVCSVLHSDVEKMRVEVLLKLISTKRIGLSMSP